MSFEGRFSFLTPTRSFSHPCGYRRAVLNREHPGLTMNRPTQTNRYQQNEVKPRFTVRGVYVARLLVGLLLALNIVLIFTILFSSNGLPGYRKQNQQVKELEEKVLKLKIENQKLFEMIQSLKTSPKAQEKLVRQELGWVA